jgi:hypothetical protein
VSVIPVDLSSGSDEHPWKVERAEGSLIEGKMVCLRPLQIVVRWSRLDESELLLAVRDLSSFESSPGPKASRAERFREAFERNPEKGRRSWKSV